MEASTPVTDACPPQMRDENINTQVGDRVMGGSSENIGQNVPTQHLVPSQNVENPLTIIDSLANQASRLPSPLVIAPAPATLEQPVIPPSTCNPLSPLSAPSTAFSYSCSPDSDSVISDAQGDGLHDPGSRNFPPETPSQRPFGGGFHTAPVRRRKTSWSGPYSEDSVGGAENVPSPVKRNLSKFQSFLWWFGLRRATSNPTLFESKHTCCIHACAFVCRSTTRLALSIQLIHRTILSHVCSISGEIERPEEEQSDDFERSPSDYDTDEPGEDDFFAADCDISPRGDVSPRGGRPTLANMPHIPTMKSDVSGTQTAPVLIPVPRRKSAGA